MRKAPDSITGFVLYTSFFVVTTLFALAAAIFWYMSPLGLGFARWPVGGGHRLLADTAFRTSYFVGIPMLLVGQIASAVLESRGRRSLAYAVPSATILFFVANVSLVLSMVAR